MLHSKFWQGFFALAPMLCLFLAVMGYLIFIFAMVSGKHMERMDSGEPPMAFFGGLGIFLLLIFIVLLLSLASLVFYIVHAAQNPNLRQNNLLVIWILLFVFANGLGQLIYWIIEILNKKQLNTP
jgi:hypothetical protein